MKRFEFEGHEVRTVLRDGEPWFVLKDVCEVLGISNARMAKARLDTADVSSADVWSGANNRSYRVHSVSESGLYDVILDSRKPQAKAFRRWVTSEVLPTIRRRGVYVTDEVAKQSPADIMARAILVANEQLEKQKREIEGLIQEREENAPRIEFAEMVEATEETITLTEMAKLISSAIGNTSVIMLTRKLREKGYLFKRPVNGIALPTKKALENGVFDVKERTCWSSAEQRVVPVVQTRVTGTGQAHLLRKFIEWCEEDLEKVC